MTPPDAVGRLLFNVLAMVAESDLIRPHGDHIEALTTSSRRRPSRIPHPCGTPTPHHARMGLSALMGFPIRSKA